MATIQELYNQLLEIHKKIDTIWVELQTAKLVCEQAKETEAAYDIYFKDVFKILTRKDNKDFLRTLDAKAEKILNGLRRFQQSDNLSEFNKKLLDLKIEEISFKVIPQKNEIDYLKLCAGASSKDFQNNIYTICSKKNADDLVVSLYKTRILHFLPAGLAYQTTDPLFKKIASYAKTSQGFAEVIVKCGEQQNETPLFWGKLAEHLGVNGRILYKQPNIEVARQPGNVCFLTSCAIVNSFYKKISLSPHPSPSDPESPNLIKSFADPRYLNIMRAYMTESQFCSQDPDEITLSQDVYVANLHGLGPMALDDKHLHPQEKINSRFAVITDLVQKKGPLVVSYVYPQERIGHAIVVTGYAIDPEAGYVLCTDPIYPGQTIVKSKDFLQHIRPLERNAVNKKYLAPNKDYISIFIPQDQQPAVASNVVVPNPIYKPGWHPGINISPYYGTKEFEARDQSPWTAWLSEQHDVLNKNNQPINEGLWHDNRHLYAYLVAGALDIADQYPKSTKEAKAKFLKNTQDILEAINQINKVKYFDDDPVFFVRFQSAIEATEQGNYKEVIDIDSMPSGKLIEKKIDRFFKFYPELETVALPKTPKGTTLSFSLGVPRCDEIVFFHHQTQKLGGMARQEVQNFGHRAVTHFLTRSYRYHPWNMMNNADIASRYLMLMNKIGTSSGSLFQMYDESANKFFDYLQVDNNNPLTYHLYESARDTSGEFTKAANDLSQRVVYISTLPSQLDDLAYRRWQTFWHEKCYDMFSEDGGAVAHAVARADLPGIARCLIKFSSDPLVKPLPPVPNIPEESWQEIIGLKKWEDTMPMMTKRQKTSLDIENKKGSNGLIVGTK